MSTQPSNYSDDRARRVNATVDRVRSLDDDGLRHVEAQLAMLDKVAAAPAPIERRIVQGAVVTERPDLVAAAGGTLIGADGRLIDNRTGVVTIVNGSGGTVQAPEPEKPAEVAKVGGATR